MVQTVMKKQMEGETLVYPYSSLSPENGNVTFNIQGQTGERSYEDREVYLNINDITMWLRGENAIQLGQKLIDHGTFALTSNRINHQHIHQMNQYKRYLSEGIVEGVELVVVDENPVNYGAGFRTYRITPSWIEGKEPEYNEDFSFETVIYWSPFEDEYHDQLDYYTEGLSYSILGYDRLAEVNAFKDVMEENQESVGEQPVTEEQGESLLTDVFQSMLKDVFDQLNELQTPSETPSPDVFKSMLNDVISQLNVEPTPEPSVSEQEIELFVKELLKVMGRGK